MWIQDYKQKLFILEANMKPDKRKVLCDAMISEHTQDSRRQ